MHPTGIRMIAGGCILLSSVIASLPRAAAASETPREVELIEDIVPGPSHSHPTGLTFINGKIFFSAAFEFDGSLLQGVWVSDGTSAGTVMLDPPDNPRPINPSAFSAVGSLVFFVAMEHSVESDGYELWVTDGTASGTNQVKDINPGNFSSLGTGAKLAPLGDEVCFSVSSSLWCSDGTEAGTREVKDIYPEHTGDIIGREKEVLGDTVYFAARDGVHGLELWKSDGTEAGTALVSDALPGPNGIAPEGFVAWGDRLYFRSAEHPTMGSELWVSDGTDAGTLPVRDIDDGPGGSNPQHLTPLGDKLYFSASDGTNGVELWATDGTEDGTAMVADIGPGDAWSAPHNLTAVRDEIFFSADDGTHGFELWKHVPASGATVLVREIAPGNTAGNAFPQNFVAVDDVAYFEASDWTTGGGLTGGELWRSDGTFEGTTLARDINPGAEGSLIEEMTAVGGSSMFFSAYHPDNGIELWRADPARLSTTSTRALEGDTGKRTVAFKVKLSRIPDSPVQVTFATQDGRAKAGKDYIARAGTITIPTGQRTAKIRITILGDRRKEGNESFALRVGQVQRRPVIVRETLKGRITDDD